MFLDMVHTGRPNNGWRHVKVLQQSAAKKRRLKFILKNVMSLNAQHREDELFEEMKMIEWDLAFLNEKWREAKEEVWTSEEGHLFCGSGGFAGHCGEAVVINSKCNARLRAFHAR